jgi:hypothetical protein
MVVRWISAFIAVFFLVATGYGQSYSGYYIDRYGTTNEAVFLIEPVLLSRQPDFKTIINGVSCIENGQKMKLTPGKCQSLYIHSGNEVIEFLSLPNLIGKDQYAADSIFLRPRIIGPATLYYYYYIRHFPNMNFHSNETVVARRPGPLSKTKQGWIIAKEDGTTIRITRKSKKKEIADFFRDYYNMARLILNGKENGNVHTVEKLVVNYNSWKHDQEKLRANIKE